jgi:hypothetical protein
MVRLYIRGLPVGVSPQAFCRCDFVIVSTQVAEHFQGETSDL